MTADSAPVINDIRLANPTHNSAPPILDDSNNPLKAALEAAKKAASIPAPLVSAPSNAQMYNSIAQQQYPPRPIVPQHYSYPNQHINHQMQYSQQTMQPGVNAMHGFPRPMSMPMQMGRGMPLPLPNRGGPAPAPAAAAIHSLDPVNDVTMWSEHATPDGRKYWHNRGTGESTARKPICLKTPEERALADCIWTEFTAPDSRKYYSAEGRESQWTMPEEYRQWKEAMDAIEAKKAPLLADGRSKLGGSDSSKDSGGAALSSSAAVAGTTVFSTPYSSSASGAGKKRKGHPGGGTAPAEEIVLTFESKAEAVDAFKALLKEWEIGTQMKMKDVSAILQQDGRWSSLSKSLNAGERNQGLAEYQTCKAKEEKEWKKQEQKRNREAFLVLLAETVEIDAQTRWIDAIDALKGDPRYRAIEAMQQREDLFLEFIEELDKQQREDRLKARDGQRNALVEVLDSLAGSGLVSRKSTWGDSRALVMEEYLRLPLVKASRSNALDEADVRRIMMEYVAMLEEHYKEEMHTKRDAAKRAVRARMDEFAVFLESWALATNMKLDMRWRDLILIPEIKGATSYMCLISVMQENERLLGGSGSAGEPRDVFDTVVQRVKDIYRAEKRLVRLALEATGFRMEHDTSQEQCEAVIAGIVGGAFKEDVDTGRSKSPPEKDGRNKWTPEKHAELRALCESRPTFLRPAVEQLLLQAAENHAEDQRRQRRREERFLRLLQDVYYRSDQVGITWDEAKKELENDSAYDGVCRETRRRLFSEHIADLNKRLEGVKGAVNQQLEEEGEINSVVLVSHSAAESSSIGKRPRSTDRVDDRAKRSRKDSK